MNKYTSYSIINPHSKILIVKLHLQAIPDSHYYETESKLLKWAMEANDRGDYFPVWGICLGFQFMTNFFLNSNRTVDQHEDLRGHCRSFDLSQPFRPTEVFLHNSIFNFIFKRY